jgi:hypothetical protein
VTTGVALGKAQHALPSTSANKIDGKRIENMIYGRDKVRTLTIASTLLVGCASPNLAMAQSANSLPDGPVACAAFQRDDHGSWTVLRPTTVYPNGVPLSLAPGQTFAPNRLFEGFEVSAILDRSCGNQ